MSVTLHPPTIFNAYFAVGWIRIQLSSASSSSASSAPSSAAAASATSIVFPDTDGPRLYEPGDIPTKDILVQLEVECRTMLHVSIPSPGRYLLEDTARKHILSTRIIPDLRWGKLPSADDYKAITMGRVKDLKGGDKVFLTEWANLHRPDVRKKATANKRLRQTTLVFAVGTGMQFGRRAGGRGGRPRSYVFDWGPAKGMNLGQVAREKGPIGTFSCGGAVVAWLGGPTFTWEFPDQLQLFVELQDLERCGYVMTSRGSRHELEIVKSHRDKFKNYVERDDPWLDDAVLVARAQGEGGGVGVSSVEDAKSRVEVRPPLLPPPCPRAHAIVYTPRPPPARVWYNCWTAWTQGGIGSEAAGETVVAKGGGGKGTVWTCSECAARGQGG